ncbi:hypothetical protein C8F01DRAFT_1173010 [Mycena amicta]|nr:hypothetical protein C8F01DRAFT_1173010 [Mycena amicta]
MAQRPQPNNPRTESTENSRLLSQSQSPTTPPPPVNRATRPQTAGVMDNVWNVFQLVHGVGETIRGTILGAIDDVENRGEQRHHEIARAGQTEVATAARSLGLWSGSDEAEGAPSTTGYDAQPPSYTSGYGTGTAANSSSSGDTKRSGTGTQ